MTSICIYFQVHQPFRLKEYSFLNIGNDHNYGALDINHAIIQRVADHCYLPANKKIAEIIEQTGGRFKVAYSISGTCLEQLEQFRPDVIESFKSLVDTGCVELLAETYYHSLAFNYAADEFERQIKMHTAKLKKLFKYNKPKTLRNTELIYNNDVAKAAKKLGFKNVICEGVDQYMGKNGPLSVYDAHGTPSVKCLLRHYGLSDDIAFRFGDPNWSEQPLLAPKYAHWLHKLSDKADVIVLGMDYETFGEHTKAETGIFDFLEHLPTEILKYPEMDFKTPAEVGATYKPIETYDVPNFTSWATAERSLAAWADNNMQKDALRKIYSLEKKLRKTHDEDLLDVWGKLQTSDHFYYMTTRFWSDNVHQSFNHYNTPYDAYINFMNVISDFERFL